MSRLNVTAEMRAGKRSCTFVRVRVAPVLAGLISISSEQTSEKTRTDGVWSEFVLQLYSLHRLKKQAEGKKRMKTIGNVAVPQDAFLAILSRDGSQL